MGFTNDRGTLKAGIKIQELKGMAEKEDFTEQDIVDRKTLARDDQFNISNYIQGLKDFVLNCNMPMTVAIQGDWGTGKTSIMEMVIHEIVESQKNNKANGMVVSIKFNTWEHSQFNLGSQISYIMIRELVQEIEKQTGSSLNDEKK